MSRLFARLCAVTLLAPALAVTAPLTDLTSSIAGAVPNGASAFVPLTPTRIVDTRLGLGAPKAKVAANSSLLVQVTGEAGVPANAVAAIMNVTATNTENGGWLQVFPTGRAAIGSSSTLNIDFANQTIPNTSFAPLGDGGRVTIFSTVTTDVLVDVAGYFVPASSATSGRFVPVTPDRVLDTRIGVGWTPPTPPTPAPPSNPGPPATPPGNPGDTKNCSDFSSQAAAQAWFSTYYPYYGDVAKLDANNDGVACESLPYSVLEAAPQVLPLVSSGTTITLQVGGFKNIPAETSGVVLNVTAASPQGDGYVQVAPTPVDVGASSSLNTSPGRTVANLVVVPTSSGGTIDFYTNVGTELIADVVGYFTSASAPSSDGGLFVPATPDRQFDSRQPQGTPPLAATSRPVIDIGDLAPGALAVTGNLTATGAAAPGWAQLGANPISIGAVSSINTAYAGQTIANAVISGLSTEGLAQAYVDVSTHLVLDVTGWFTRTSAAPSV